MTESDRQFLKESILAVLLEDVQQNEIVDAVAKRHEAVIRYDDGADGERLIKPVAYGLSTSGNPVVRAYQESGSTKTGNKEWKEFLVDKLISWETRKDTTFDEPPGYSPNGDLGMQTVYVASNFGDLGMQTVYVPSNFGGGTGGNHETSTATPEVTNVQQTPTQDNIGNDVAGIQATTRQTSPSSQSWREMKQANNFGSNRNTQTIGPVRKGEEEEIPTDDTLNKTEYTQVVKNGPQYKRPEEPEEETETDGIDNLNFVDDEDEEENKETEL